MPAPFASPSVANPADRVRRPLLWFAGAEALVEGVARALDGAGQGHVPAGSLGN